MKRPNFLFDFYFFVVWLESCWYITIFLEPAKEVAAYKCDAEEEDRGIYDDFKAEGSPDPYVKVILKENSMLL